MKLKWFDNEYRIIQGEVLTENYNETLDSFSVILENTEDEIDFEPLDLVQVIDDNSVFNTRYMCIESFNQTMICVNPRIYTYELRLISETKLLEGIVLPNLKITKNIDVPRTILHYLEQYLSEYGEKRRFGNQNGFYWNERWRFSNKVRTRFSQVICPEMQWTQPTLREVFNDLMMIDDCIVVVKNNVIDCIDLTETKTDRTNDEHINFVNQSRSVEDYVSELQVDMKNVVQTEINGVKNIVSSCDYIPFKPQDGFILNSDNVVLKTRYPIYKIKKLSICTLCTATTHDGSVENYLYWANKDMTEIVYEKSVFDLLPLITKTSAFESFTTADLGHYQNTSLYFTRGSNIITNFTYLTSNQIEFVAKQYLLNLIVDYIASFLPTGHNYDKLDYYTFFFKVEYETTIDSLFRASKGDYPRNYRVVRDNQSNAYVDAYSQGFLEYQKANRLGNLIKQINARYDINSNLTESDLIKIGDTFDDSVIFQVQYQIYDNYIGVNALATKGYVLRDYFTGVKAKVRSTILLSGSEAFLRNDLIKYYCIFSYNLIQDSIDDLGNDNVSKYFCSAFLTDNNIKTFSLCLLKAKGNSGDIPNDTNKYYQIDFTSRIVGNSLKLDFSMNDNVVFAYNYDLGEIGECNNDFTLITDSIVSNGVPIKALFYTDDNGENNGYEIIFSNSSQYTIGAGYYFIPDREIERIPINSGNKEIGKELYEKPLIDLSVSHIEYEGAQKIKIDFNKNKDNGEITSVGVQFEFGTDDKTISFGKAFLERQDAIRTIANSSLKMHIKGKVIIGTSTQWQDVDTTYDSSVSASILNISNTVSKISFNLTNIYIQKGSMLTILDNDDNKILEFVVQENSSEPFVYLNILKTRNINIYDNETNQNIVCSLKDLESGL